MTTTVAIYTRLSKDESGTQTATKRQEQACRAIAQAREWEVDEVYEDVDLSAFKKGVIRPSYELLLRAIEERQVAGVIVWKLDRLVRRSAEFERFWSHCEANGAMLVSATEPIDTSTELGVALVRILISFAGLESATLGLRIRARLGEQARAGHPPSHMGFGFKKNPVRVVPKHARLIQDAADKVLAGESLRSIANDWNRKGVRTIRGSLWNYHTVKKLLCSHRIAGDREYRGEVVAKDCWPAILDHDTFERVRMVILAPKRMDKSNVRRHLLTGLIFCGRCDGNFRAGKNHDVLAYRCPSAPHGCGRVQVNCAALDQYILDEMCEHLRRATSFGYAPFKASSEATDSARSEIETHKARIKNLSDDYYRHRVISEGEYLRHRDALLEEVKKVIGDAGLRSPDAGSLPTGDVLRARWTKMEVKERRAQLDLVISRIVVSSARRKDFDPSRVEVHWYREARSRRSPIT